MKKPGHLTISEAALILDVHPDTLRRWEDDKKLIPVRDSDSGYRYYSLESIQQFLIRGAKAKIEVRWGYDPKRARLQELERARKTLDIIASKEATTPEPEIHQELLAKGKVAIENGMKARVIRNLADPRMKEIADDMQGAGYETKDGNVFGVTISILDKKEVRIEIPSDDPNKRFDIIIRDQKVAWSFALFFEKLWEG